VPTASKALINAEIFNAEIFDALSFAIEPKSKIPMILQDMLPPPLAATKRGK
jgi:hypothetical protein